MPSTSYVNMSHVAGTYPYMLTLNKNLGHNNDVSAQTFTDLGLCFSTHEDVTFFVLHHQVAQYLLHQHAVLVSLSHNSHCGSVDNYFACFLLLVVLQNENYNSWLISWFLFKFVCLFVCLFWGGADLKTHQ